MSEPINGRRVHFNVLATSVPKLLVPAGSRQAVVFISANTDVYLGYSGSLTSTGILLGSTLSFQDLFSSDEWWVATSSGSGTVSGYVIV